MATPGEVNFAHPKLREYLGNLLNEDGGPFAHVDGDARKLLKELLHCRNADTGKCCPSWEYLARATGDKPRNVGYMLGRLASGPSRQSDGRIVDGHGLIWRRSDRRGFRRLPTQYGITCRLLILAGLVLPHNCMECRCGTAWSAEERGSAISGSSDLSLRPKYSQNKGEPRTRARAPFVKSSPQAAPENDPILAAFVVVFERQRFAKYGDNAHGSLSTENRDKLAAYLADLVAGSRAWAEQEGVDGARADVADALFERLARLWLEWPGTGRFLCDRRHPIGLLIGDLEKFGKLARASWKRAQRKPKPLEAHEAPAGAVSATGYAEQLQAQAEAAEAALPEFDAAELIALAQLQPHEPATSPTAADVAEPAIPVPLVRAPVLRALPVPAPSEERGKLAASARAHARALLAALAPPPSPERSTLAAASVLEDEPAPTPAPTTTEKRPRNDRGGTEADTDPAPGLEAPREAPESARPPRVRRPGSRPFTGTTGAPGRRPDAWRSIAQPEAPADDDDPPDE